MKRNHRLEILKKGLDKQVEEFVSDSEVLREFVEFYRRNFKQYSPRNLMLIFRHNRFATYIAGFRKWKELGYKVKLGEKARNILAPIKNKLGEIEKYVFVPVFDDSQVEPTDNAIAFPKVNTDYKKGKSSYKISSLFKATKEVIEEDIGKVIEYYDSDNANGKTDGVKIYLKKRKKLGMLGTLIHEYTHFKRHFNKNIKVNKNEAEVEAEIGSIIFGSIFNFEIENKFYYLHNYKTNKINLSEVFERILPFSTNLADRVITKLNY